MSLGNALVTGSTTALFGTLVLVFGQVISKFLIDPIHEQRKTLGEIAYNLTFLANAGSMLAQVEVNGEKILASADPREATATVRRLASQLRASLKTIPLYDSLASINIVPKQNDVIKASTLMIGWSNEIWGGGRPNDRRKQIAKALNIKG